MKNLVITHGIRTKKYETWPTDLKWVLDNDKVFSRFVNTHVFRYEYINVFEAVAPWKHGKIRREFQSYLKNLSANNDGPISVLAHSFGTHTTMNSLRKGLLENRPNLDLIVLTGCIVDKDYPFNDVMGKFRKVINFVSSEDASASNAIRPTFGRAGSRGFDQGTQYLADKKQWAGVYNTEDLETEHMDFWKKQDQWFPFLIDLLKRELILKDSSIQEILTSEQGFLKRMLSKIGWSSAPIDFT